MSDRQQPILLLATTNSGKVAELERLLANVPVVMRSLAQIEPTPPPVEEDCPTYLGNAELKALTIARWSGQLTLADDSGLEVDALGGLPGVRSARYAGPQQDSRANVNKLLAALRGVPPEKRTARFRCVLVVASPTRRTVHAEGVCEGRIAGSPSGSAGFGYDPIFIPLGSPVAFAAMTEEEKNVISHRALACRNLQQQLPPFLEMCSEARRR